MNTIYETTGRAKEYALLALNLYKGCPHGCVYCYVPGIVHLDKEDFHCDARNCPRDGVIYSLEKAAKNYTGTSSRVNMCFICDPYPAGRDAGTTREALIILRKNYVPFSILTKGGLAAARDFDLYNTDIDSGADVFGVTLTVPDESDRRIIEPGAASIADRIATLEEAHKRGIFTFVSLEPAFDTEMVLRLIEMTSAFTDHYKIGCLNYLRPGQLGIRVKVMDWRELGVAAIDALEKLNKTFYVKDELAKHITAKVWTQTDTRRIEHTQYQRTWSITGHENRI